QKIAFHTVGVRTPGDVMNIQVRDGRGDNFTASIENGMVHEHDRESSHSPSFVLFEARTARKSGLLAAVRSTDCSRRNASIFLWSPDLSTSGTPHPSYSAGRVYWGYSRPPPSASLKDSSRTESSFPSTPGRNRMVDSMTAIAA